MSSHLFKMLHTKYSLTNHIYFIDMYKQDLALNNLLPIFFWLSCANHVKLPDECVMCTEKQVLIKKNGYKCVLVCHYKPELKR